MAHENVFCITGGSGFVGAHLIRCLQKNPENLIRSLSRKSVPNPNKLSSQTEWIKGNLLEPSSLKDFLIPGATLIHLAYLNSDETNRQAINNLISACQSVGIGRLIHCSTSVLVGRVLHKIVDETTPCYPSSSYEQLKLEIEKLLLHSSLSCPIGILRPTMVFGINGKNLIKIFQDIERSDTFKNAIRLSLFSSRSGNFVSVHNVAKALKFLSDRAILFQREVFICSDDDDSKNTYAFVVKKYLTALGRAVPLSLPLPRFFSAVLLAAKGDSKINPSRLYSNKKLIQLGFQKDITFEAALDEFISYFLQNKRVQL